MKKIKFTCSNCQAKLRVPTHLAGVTAPCPKCGHKITAPTDYESIVVEETPAKAPAAVAASQRTRVATATAKSVSSPPLASPSHEGHFSPSVSESPTARTPDSKKREEIAPLPPIEAPPEPSQPPAVSSEHPSSDDGPSLPPPILDETVPETDENEAPISLPPLDLPTETSSPEPLFPSNEEIEEPDAPIVSDLPEPASPKTQPIRVSSRPDHLPEMRPVRDEETGSLPRLDISLGEGSSSAGKPPAAFNGESQEKTRLHLPQPGDLSNDDDLHQFSPDDFIIPSDGGEAPREDAPKAVESEPVVQPPAIPEPEEVEAAPPVSEESVLPEKDSDLTEVLFNSDPAPANLQDSLGSPDFLEEVAPPAAPPAIPADPVSEEAPERKNPEDLFSSPGDLPEETPDPLPSSGESSLNEGSFEKLFAQQSSSPPDIPPGIPSEADSGEPVTVPLPETAQPSPSTQVLPIPSETVPVEPNRSESDVLDEMFGSSPPESKGMSKSTVVMLCSVGAVVIIATVLVVVIGMAFGGFSVSGPGEEDTQEDATSMLMAKKDEEKSEEPEPVDPTIDDAPAVIDPVATERVEPSETADDPSSSSSTVTLPGDTEKPVMIVDHSSGAPEALPREEGLNDVVEEAKRAIQGGEPGEPTAVEEPKALSFDDALDQFGGNGSAGSADPAKSSFTDAGDSLINGDSSAGFPSTMPLANGDAADKSTDGAAASGAPKNYNPPESFAAPGPEEGPLVRINDLIDAFLRAPDWETRLKYCYNAESLRPAMEEYYQKWPDNGFTRFSQQMFQMELDKEMGGPYWVYLISTSDEDQGFPLIIRVEDGNLKVDWEIFAEFNDRHFAKFLKGEMPNPGTYRVVLERKSDYYGTDRDAFTTLNEYNVYEVNAPYGALNEFSGYAFVKKDSPVAKELDAVLGLNDEPLAVIATLERVTFDHGTKHMVINEYVTEGWFQN